MSLLLIDFRGCFETPNYLAYTSRTHDPWYFHKNRKKTIKKQDHVIKKKELPFFSIIDEDVAIEISNV